jgi:hypothetical protein
VPDLPGDALGFRSGFDREDFRVFRVALRGVGMDVKLAEALAKRLVLIDGHILVAEENDAMVEQRLVNGVKLLVGERLAEVDAGDLGADGGRERVDRYGHGRAPYASP